MPFHFKYPPDRDLRRLLLAYPNVIALVNGHTHANLITQHARAANQGAPGGFWEISTASHIDWPIQSRIIEVASSGSGVSLFTTMVDIAAPLSYAGDLSTPSALASLARELAANDPQERRQIVGGVNADGTAIVQRRGTLADRNTQLMLPAPCALPPALPAASRARRTPAWLMACIFSARP